MSSKKLVAGLLALALLGACSSGDDDDAGAVAGDDTTSTSEDAVDTAALQAELDGRLLTAADLDTGNDLDAGWEAGDVSSGVDITLPDCLLEDPQGAVVSSEVKLVTKNDFKLPSLEEDLSAYEDGGAAEAFTAASTRLDGCVPDFVFQGTPATGAIERLTLTLGGEQSAAWRTTVTIAGAPVSITNIHVQDGDHEVSFVHVDLAAAEPAVLEGYVSKALAKLA